MAVFIDSSVLCAFANERDVHHKNAVKIFEDVIHGKYGKPITTDYIFDEIMSVTIRRTNRRTAVLLGTTLLNSEIFIAKIDAGAFQKAWELFKDVTEFNFTDCTILSFMKSFEIKKLATFDKAFKKIKWLEVIEK